RQQQAPDARPAVGVSDVAGEAVTRQLERLDEARDGVRPRPIELHTNPAHTLTLGLLTRARSGTPPTVHARHRGPDADEDDGRLSRMGQDLVEPTTEVGLTQTPRERRAPASEAPDDVPHRSLGHGND